MRAAGLLVALVLCGGCLVRAPRPKLEQPTPIAIATIVDPDRGGAPRGSPEAVRAVLAAALAEHNLRAVELPSETVSAKRLSEARLAAVRGAAKAPWFALVELRARYFSQLEGRYRWEVSARVSVGRGDEVVAQDAFTVPVLLSFEHEREADALTQAAPDVAVRLSALVEGLLAGAGVKAAAGPPKSIYFVMVDRFSNGDRANDGDADPADPQAFHGGDVRGLIERLDWLQGLGVDTVWLSPVNAMRTEKWHGFGAFHGYWTWRLDALEPRLTDEATLRELSQQLHHRGMKLVLDLVLNHVGPDAPLLKEHPDWFHSRGGITDWNDPVQLVEGDVHGLTDFAQERPEAGSYLFGAARRWLRARPA